MSKCNPMQFRKRQLFGAIETKCGEPVELKATDAKVAVEMGQNADPDVTMIERQIAKASLTKSQSVIGAVKGEISFTTEVIGSGSAAEPPCSVYLQGCGFNKIALKRLPITWKNDARPVRGDVIGVDANNTARVSVVEDKGVVIEVLKGTLDSSTIKIGATEIGTSGTASDAGFEYQPQSSSFKRLSIRSEEDGYRKSIYSAMGNLSLSAKSSEIAKMEFSFSGLLDYKGKVLTIASAADALSEGAEMVCGEAKGVLLRDIKVGDTEVWYTPTEGAFKAEDEIDVGEKQIIAASDPLNAGFGSAPMTEGVSLPSLLPPTLQGAQLKIGSFSPVVSSISIETGNEVVVREDANSSLGFIAATITDRSPTGTVDPEMMDDESLDIYGDWFSGKQASLQAKIGSEAGNTCWVFAKSAQYESITDGDRDGVAIANINFKLIGDNDDELCFVFI